MAINLVTFSTKFDEWKNITNSIITAIGDNASLTTTEKASLVGAINELDSQIGNLASLSTTDKSSLVNAINEVITNLNTLSSNVGSLGSLTTTNKTSIVNAINELVTSITGITTSLNDVTLAIQYNNKEPNKGRYSTSDLYTLDVVLHGSISSIAVDTGGSGYTVAPSVSIVGDGTGATATAVLAATGSVKAVVINASGTGYSVDDVLALDFNGGTGATITVTSVGGAGEITGYSLTSTGSGYTASSIGATVTGGTGSGATFDATVGFAVASITVDTNGSGYLVATVNITGDGAGATATATISTTDTFSYANYVTQPHNATFAMGDFFVNNNSTNGGTSAALGTDIQGLLTAMADSTRLYGYEFYINDVTYNSGTLDSVSVNAITYYPLVKNNNIYLGPIGGYVTWVGWVNIKSVNATNGIIIGNANTTTYIDGSLHTYTNPLFNADGWIHVRQIKQLTVDFDNIFPAIYGSTAADNIQIALSGLFAGKVNVGLHKGII